MMCKGSEDTILIINMFSGSHHDKDVVANIDHEIINLFKTDSDPEKPEYSDSSYIYVPHDGYLDAAKWDIRKVLMVRYLGDCKYQVLARAMIEKNVSDGPGNQDDLLGSICYGGKPLKTIMEESGQGFKKRKEEGERGRDEKKEKNQAKNEQITFKAECCQEPAIPIFIKCVDDEKKTCDYTPDTISSRTSSDQDGGKETSIEIQVCMLTNEGKKGALLVPRQRRYIKRGEESDWRKGCNIQPYAYEVLNKLFQKDDLNWRKEGVPSVQDYKETVCQKAEVDAEGPGASFLSLINKEDSELAYSDLLAYFLDSYSGLSKFFIKGLLEKARIDNYEEADLLALNIARESKRIDLLITTRNRVFIIENKINADLDENNKKDRKTLDTAKLNSRQKWAYGQLQRYVDAIKKEFEKSEKWATDNGFEPDRPKDIYAFIICPTRHELKREFDNFINNKADAKQRMINIGSEKRPIPRAVPVISYAEILNWLNCETEESFSQTMAGLKENSKGDRELEFFEDLVKALKWQESTQHDDRSEKFLNLNRKRFLRAITIAETVKSEDRLSS